MNKRNHTVPFGADFVQKKPLRDFREEETKMEISDSSDLARYISDQATIDHLKSNGISSLFPIQQATFNVIVKGNDLTARDKTGSGKTLAYALPALERIRRSKILTGNSPKILVIVPTRELAIQVKGSFQRLVLPGQNVRIFAVYGGDNMRSQMEAVQRGSDVIIATPGRLLDFVERNIVKLGQLKCLTLDEADEMLKQGFKEDIERVFKAVMDQISTKPQTLLFSATLPSWVRSISEQYQEKNCTVVDLIGNSQITVPDTIRHYTYSIQNLEQIPHAVKILCQTLLTKEGRCIIFCETKREVNTLFECMNDDKCEILHGDIKQRDRERICRDFKSGRVLKVVATNVAARGLDFPSIELVIQVEPPKQVEAYIHRAGRTGRAGKKGVSVVLTRKRDTERIYTIEKEGGFKFVELKEKDLKKAC